MKLVKWDKVKTLFTKLGHPLFTVIGVVSLGIGGAFVGSYKFAVEWAKVVDVATFIAFVLTNSYLWLFGGAILYLLSEYVRYEKTKKIESENNALRDKVSEKEVELGDKKNKTIHLKKNINLQQEEIQVLNNQIDELQRKIAVSWLKQAFKQHEINSTERASIYFELNKEFSVLARYSPNPELNEIHRQKFPLNQGVISHAWRNGDYIEDGCPDFASDETKYYNYMSEKYGFSLDELLGFQMKSCCYVAVAIRNVDDHIGVVVFESTDKDKLNSSKLQQLKEYCEKYEGHLVEFIQGSKALEAAKRMRSARTTDAESDVFSSLSGGSYE